MKRCILLVVAVSLLTHFPLLAVRDWPAKKPVPKDDAKSIQGTWVVVSVEEGGKPTNRNINDKVVFKGENMTIYSKNAEGKTQVKLDSGKKPRTIDLTPNVGAGKRQLLQGIYTLEADVLKICYARPGQARPTKFVTQWFEGRVIVVLKRQKP